MIFTIGLVFIVIGWMAQVYRTIIKKERTLNPAFLLFYAIGCVLLSTGNFIGSETISGILNSIVVILAAFLLLVLVLRK